MALEDDYRLYREMLAVGLRIKRTAAEVQSATLEALEEELERFDPQVIICSGHKVIKSGVSRVWIELTLDTILPARGSVGPGCSFEMANPTVEELLEVIDELAQLIDISSLSRRSTDIA